MMLSLLLSSLSGWVLLPFLLTLSSWFVLLFLLLFDFGISVLIDFLYSYILASLANLIITGSMTPLLLSLSILSIALTMRKVINLLIGSCRFPELFFEIRFRSLSALLPKVLSMPKQNGPSLR